MKERIHIYYTNDLHSHFDNWPKVTAFLKKKRKSASHFGEFSVTVDIGDHMDRVHPITEATLGQANVSLLNEAKYDVVTLGNNEGITLGHGELDALYEEAAFDVVCSNLTSTVSVNPSWLKDYRVFTTPSGVRIGFFGLTARFNPYYHLLGWDAKEIAETVRKTLAVMKKDTDVIVLLSHLGINEDRLIAERYPAIDMIIGGHTHHLLKTGEEIGSTMLTAAGKGAAYAGETTLTWDHEAAMLIKKEAYAIDITHLEADQKTVEHLNEWSEKANQLLGEPVINTTKPLYVDWYEETDLMKQLTEQLLEWSKADGAMLNAGMLLESLEAGVITYKDVHAICPHPINPVVVSLTGDELMEVVRASLSEKFMRIELKGFGFRGKVLGRMVFAGFEVKTKHHREGQAYVTEILFNDLPLKKDRIYRIATGDLFTFGNLLPPVARSPIKNLLLPEFIRDVLAETLRSNY